LRHAQHAHRRTGHGVAGAHAREQRRAADRHAHRGGVARAGIAAQRQTDGPVHRAQPVGLARPGLGDAGQRFGEGGHAGAAHRNRRTRTSRSVGQQATSPRLRQ
jgi:hypothetical protein